MAQEFENAPSPTQAAKLKKARQVNDELKVALKDAVKMVEEHKEMMASKVTHRERGQYHS
jgi:hypothetical protein